MIKIILPLLFTIPLQAQIKVAVIDTGFNQKLTEKISLCKKGHKDLTNTSLDDYIGHGTNISGLIHKQARSQDYCQIIIKFYKQGYINGAGNVNRTIEALKHAIKLKVDIINYSNGGISPSNEEKEVILEALNKGIVVVVAAGNEGSNLDSKPYYPASYDKRLIVVKNLSESGSRAPTSNYGSIVDLGVVGTNRTALGYTLTGTSQATAIVTGIIIKQIDRYKLLKHNYEFFGNVSTDNYWFEYWDYMAR